MEVNESDLVGVRTLPPKHDSPLVVHANTVEALEVAFQQFETIARWRLKINEIGSAVEIVKFQVCSLEDIGRKSFQKPKRGSVEDCFCCLVPE